MIKPVTYQGVINFTANLYALEVCSRFIDQKNANGYYKGYGEELAASVEGESIKVGTGAFVIQGRMNEVTEAETVSPELREGAYGYVVARIETFHPSDENNCTLKAYVANSLEEISLKRENTYEAAADKVNRVYEVPLYSFRVEEGAITSLEKLIKPVADYATVKGIVDDALARAKEAVETANAATATANGAEEKAQAAQSAAERSAQSASEAEGSAAGAATSASAAEERATEAAQSAQTAQETSQTAVETAQGAVKTAGDADSKADAAVQTAGDADSKADAAVQTAGNADSKADNAVKTAGEAKETAEGAVQTANGAVQTANGAVQTVTEQHAEMTKEIEALREAIRQGGTIVKKNGEPLKEYAVDGIAKLFCRTAEEWGSAPVLQKDEFGLDTTNMLLKVGDGASAWPELKALNPPVEIPESVAKIYRRSSAEWAAAPVLKVDEFGLDTDTGLLKLGDGVSQWGSLAALNPPIPHASKEEFGLIKAYKDESSGDLCFET